jgi:hypothetical protein
MSNGDSVKNINWRRFALLNHWNRSLIKSLQSGSQEEFAKDDPVIEAITTDNVRLWEKSRCLMLVFQGHFRYTLRFPYLFKYTKAMIFFCNINIGDAEIVIALESRHKQFISWLIDSRYLKKPDFISLYASQLKNYEMLNWICISYGAPLLHEAVQMILVADSQDPQVLDILNYILTIQEAKASAMYEAIRLDSLSVALLFFNAGCKLDVKDAYDIAKKYQAKGCLKWLEVIAPTPFVQSPLPFPVSDASTEEQPMWVDLAHADINQV